MNTNEFQEFDSQSSAQTGETPDSESITAKIINYLRWVGSLLVSLSAISFMLQGHEQILPAYQYWIGLGLILLLCSGGLICAYLFKETKGARIFFGLGAAFLPVQISQVSAMVFSYWHGQGALQPSYRWLQFMDVSPSIIALDGIISLTLLLLVSYACYAILARKYIKTLLWTSLVGNALLLLPIRDSVIIPCLIVGLFFLLRHIELRLHKDGSMRLPEGLAARALVSLPLWIIIGRSLLYPTSSLLAVVLSVLVVVYCIFDIKRYTHSVTLIYIAQWLGTLSALGIWRIVLEQFSVLYSDQLNALLPIAIILFVLSGKVEYHARWHRLISSVMVVFLTYGAMLYQQMLAPIFSMAAGILLTMAGMKYREKVPFFSGNLCVTGGFLFYSIDMYTTSPWSSSIALGLVVILLSSYLESKEQQILAKSRYYLNELKNWN